MIYQNSVVKLSDIIIPKYHNTFNNISYMHKIFTSGRAGTKSSRGAIKAVYKIVSDDDCSVIILRKFHNKLKKTVYKEVLRAIKRLGLDKSDFKITVSPMEVKYLPNGNTIYFTGNDSIDDTKGMIDEEKPIKLVIVDELTEFFEKGEGEDEIANIEATFVRGNNDDFCMEYYFNPPKNPKSPIMQWVSKMKKRDDVSYIHVDYRDVPVEWLGEKLINSALAMKKIDEQMYNWVWLGISTGLSEIVYYMFNDDKHVNKLKDFKNLIHVGISVDYGHLNATTFQAFGLDQSSMKVQGIDEYYHSGRKSGKQKAPSEYARDFKSFYEKIKKLICKEIEAIFIDPSARGFAEEIKRVMPNIRIIAADNSVKLGIERCQKIISFDKFRASTVQENLINEFGLYRYNKELLDKGREDVIKTDDHCMDAFRYYVMGMWRYLKFLLPVTERK
ncbi:PBSX family phage terminase large subunit [Thomasclavelia cocleata]|uniref:PBSX family phage terminase large subunit n=1 Tax=Thomasclavelia cocleata TaxID=69824 RepID=UPI002575C253|nr:PBSX family phage terminase large subunit [Thomasclavelia cocleata]